jgi:leader peptidase (prepilin peptidase)/N-methyltransferase
MLFILKLFIAVICAVSGAIAGNHWIAKLYRTKENILSFPHKIFAQHESRKRYLPGVLGMLMAFYLLNISSTVLSHFFGLFFHRPVHAPSVLDRRSVERSRSQQCTGPFG